MTGMKNLRLLMLPRVQYLKFVLFGVNSVGVRDLIVTFQYIKGSYKKIGQRLFTSDRTRATVLN